MPYHTLLERNVIEIKSDPSLRLELAATTLTS